MSKNSMENVTLEELARMTAQGFADVQEKMTTKDDLANLRSEIDIMLDRHIGTFRKDYDELARRVKKLEETVFERPV